MHSIRLIAVLVGAAILEVSWDALVRMGLQRRALPMLAGALCLLVYGVVVNLGGTDFGRLMGIYIVTFFLVAEIIGVIAFGQIPQPRTAAAAGLLIAAAALMMA